MQDLKRKMAAGAAWMMLSGLCVRLLGLLSTMVLARLLVPADFGLITLAASVYGLIEILGAFNFDMALIQNQQATRQHYDTAFTLNVLYGVLAGIALCVLADPCARFFAEPRLEGVIYVFALSAAIGGFNNIGTVAFQKDLDFHREFAFVLIAKLVAAAVTISLALSLRSYWALAAGLLAASILKVAISFVVHPFRPRFDLSAWRSLVRFSGWMLFSNLIMFIGNRGYDFVIGRIAGPRSLGLYSVAYELANLPTSEIVFPVSKAVFPGFSKIASDIVKLRESFLQVCALVAFITIPTGAGIAVLADPFVRLILGSQWLEAIPLIQILAVFGIMRAMHAGVGAVFLALGRTRLIALVAMPHLVIGLPLAAVLLAKYSLVHAALGVVTAGAIAILGSLGLLSRMLDLHFSGIVQCFWRPMIATAIMVAVVGELLAFAAPLESTQELIYWTALCVLAGLVSYVVAILALWHASGRAQGPESFVLSQLKTMRASLHRAN